MEITLVGFKRFKAKTGNPLCLAVVARPYDPSDVARGFCGSEVAEVFLPDEQYNYLLPSDIGLPVSLDYDNFGGRSKLRSITVSRKKV